MVVVGGLGENHLHHNMHLTAGGKGWLAGWLGWLALCLDKVWELKSCSLVDHLLLFWRWLLLLWFACPGKRFRSHFHSVHQVYNVYWLLK